MQEAVDLLGSLCLMREYEREVELYDYIEVLFKYKWLILIATLVCGSIGWVLRPAPTPPLYEADAVLMVKNLPSAQNDPQVAISTSTQSSGFYNALALADDLKQALIDSLDLNMSLVAMDGMLSVQVLDPGVKLAVRSHDSTLPIRLVNEWAKLFVERNGDLNVEEVDTYYEWVRSQFYTERSRLDTIESQLHKFEAENSIELLQLQRSMLDSAAINVYREITNNNFQLQEAKLDSLLSNQNAATADSILKSIKNNTAGSVTITSVQTAQAKVDSEFFVALSQYDKKNNIDFVYKQQKLLYQLQKQIYLDSLQTQIEYIGRETKNHPVKISGKPNPTRSGLDAILSEMKINHTTLKAAIPENVNISLRNITMNPPQIAAIILKREEIISWYKAKNLEAKSEILRNNRQRSMQFKEAQDQAMSRYIYYATVRDSMAKRLRIVKLQQQSRQDLWNFVQKNLNTVKDTLSGKIREQKRLLRDQEVFSGTVARFSKLLEEARIAREKAAGDIRILTRALEVRQIPQEQGRHKAAVATGVGFLLSCILSLLAEYIRKARHNRLETQQKTA
jgi:uncharacterized protein involved in exopolysaccharide biosynthesis